MRKQNSEIEQGRAAYAGRAWDQAYHLLSRADAASPLGEEDVERLALAASLSGRTEAMIESLDRLYQIKVQAGSGLGAARAAFWLFMRLMSLGDAGRAGGWLVRAQRLVESEGRECAEQGYILLPAIQRSLAAGDFAAAEALAANAAEIGVRFADADLMAFGRCFQGRSLLLQGSVEEGLALLDECMVSATSGDLSPVVTGLIYCIVIVNCQLVYAFARAREWTTALAAWCDAQPELVTFTGSCLVHRAEILQLNGAWGEAIVEARRVVDRFGDSFDREALGDAFYQEGEIHRLRGSFDKAEEAYRNASQAGTEPQPGLALLRVAQGRADAAAATMRGALGATTDRVLRARLLPAHIEVMLAAGDIEEARAAGLELEEIAAALDVEILHAVADHATGAVRLAEGDAQGALAPLRRAFAIWQQIGAPYIAARIRVLIGLACRALGDEDGARLAFDGARSLFDELGATPDTARVDGLLRGTRKRGGDGLTLREIEVLRLVAGGKTNKAIARQLSLSEKTVDRHLSNILTKLGVPSRAAATAHAYENKLI